MKFLAGLHLLSIVGSIDASGIADDNNKGRVGSIRELPAYPQRLPLSVGDVDGDLSLEPVSIGNGTPILESVGPVGDDTSEEPPQPYLEDGEGLDDIPTTIKKINFFTTLVAALGAANLVPALSGAGPFTVFAPVDDAFAALPAALVPCLLLPKNKAVLTAILSYHVVDGGLAAYNLVDTQVIPTWLEGQDVTAKRLDDGTVRINKAHLILEILTTNGVVHAIDAVLVPASVDVTAFLATCPAVDGIPDKEEQGTPEEPQPQQPTPAQLCGGAFLALQFDIFNYAKYNTYFDESSTLTLAQTGTYTGPDAIQEYVYFADENSSYIQAKRNYVQETVPTGFDPLTNICKFTTYYIQGVDFQPGLTTGSTVNYGAITHTYYSAVTNKVPVIQVYYTAPMLEAFFTQLQTRQVNDFVCDVLLGPGCMAELGDQAEQGLTRHKCVKRLSRLPLNEGEENWIDGNSKGCRYLHAEFALKNTYHCAHVSLIPAEDPKGNIKCQTSAYLSPDKFFTQAEIDGLYDICGTQTALGLDQNTCFHEIPRHHPSSKKSKKSKK